MAQANRPEPYLLTSSFTGDQNPRRASSASSARLINFATIPVFLPVAGSMKSPSSAKLTTEATAPPWASDVGRIMDTGPNFEFRKNVGSGMIRLVWNRSATVSPPPIEPVAPVLGSTPVLRGGQVRLHSVMVGAFPALSCQTWQYMVSLGPMLRRTRKTSRLVTF